MRTAATLYSGTVPTIISAAMVATVDVVDKGDAPGSQFCAAR